MELGGTSVQPLALTSFAPAALAKSAEHLPSFGATCMKPVDSLSSLDTQCPSDDEEHHVMRREEILWDSEPDSDEADLCVAPHAAPSQTLLCLDWDDTLFPTTELIEHRHVSEWGKGVPADVEADLGPWREALKSFLNVACSTSGRCVILTNAKRPWVDVCIDRFVPMLRPMFSKNGGLRVVYADEALKRSRNQSEQGASCCLAGLTSWLLASDRRQMDAEQKRAELTAGKRAGMEEEASNFYGAGAAWENVVSVGDASYERNAVLSLIGGSGAGGGARRAKAIAVPRDPTLECIVDSLQLSQQHLQSYVAFDGHLDVKQRADCLLSAPKELRAFRPDDATN